MGYTQSEVAAWFESRGSEFIGVYKNSVSPIQYRCVQCGVIDTYVGFVKMKNRNERCFCHRCNKELADQHKLEVMGLERHQAWAKERGSEIVQYTGATELVQFRCSTCGTIEVYSNINNLVHNNDKCCCKECNKRSNGDRMKITISEVRAWFQERGAEFVGNEYKGHAHPIKFKCAWCKTEVQYSTFSAPRARNPKICLCSDCGKVYNSESRLKDEAEVKQWFLDHNSELLSQYRGLDRPVIFRCSECGKTEEYYNFRNIQKVNPECTCKVCSRERANKTHRKDESEVKAWFRERGSELYSIYKSSTNPIKFKCSRCGKPAEYKRGFASIKKDNPRCWCKVCNNEMLTGANHPSWNPDLTQEERDKKRYEGPEYRAWTKAVYEKHEYKCAVTGNGGVLSAHHIFNWAQHPQLRTMIWNGVCLEKELHDNFHNQYGRGFNNFKQFTEWYKTQTGSPYYLIDQPDLKVDLIYPEPIPESNPVALRDRKAAFARGGVRYIPIFLWEVLSKPNIVDSMIGHRAGSDLITVGARKLNLVRVTVSQARAFFEANHRQGHLNGSVNLALTDGSVLLSVMNFTKSRNPAYQWELERFASLQGYRVPGAASRLFKWFLEEEIPQSIKTYADLRYSDWDFDKTVYAKLGFISLHHSEPNYFYSKDGIGMFSRVQFQKHRLEMVLEEYNSNMTEKENMAANGYQIYYDCGNHVAVWRN